MNIPRVTTIPPGYLPNAELPDVSAVNVRLIHAVALYRMAGDTMRRHEVAKASWEQEYNRTGRWLKAWLDIKDAPRSSKQVGDPRGVHFIHDLMNYAAAQCPMDSDVIVLTNSDNSFVFGITERLTATASQIPTWAHRMDFPRITRMMSRQEALKGKWFAGFDLVACRKDWWLQHRDEYQDVLIGCSGWDLSMYVLMRKYGGQDLGCSVVHEFHRAFWHHPEVRRSNPGELWNQKHNRPLLMAHGISEEDCKRFA